MVDHAKRAEELFYQGYNCCQAVLCAFADELPIDERTLFSMASSFGGGMGRLREVCGAVSAMFLIAGLKFGYRDPKDLEAKGQHYQRIQQLAHQFSQENGSIICRQLLGLREGESEPTPEARTAQYYQKRPCAKLVRQGAQIIENYLERMKTMKIAVTYEDGKIFQHFGHTQEFKIYTVEEGKIMSSEVVSTGDSGHSALAQFLQERDIYALICGGIGAGAKQALAAAGIKLYGGVSGDADEKVQALLDGKLEYNPDIQCSHHEGEHHECHGHHGEGHCHNHHECHGHGPHHGPHPEPPHHGPHHEPPKPPVKPED